MRKIIYTDELAINQSNIVEVLRKSKVVHDQNVKDINFLLEYEEGKQPLLRKKLYRPDIDTEVVDNVAHEVVQFNLGYKWGNPITLIQRGEKDSGNTDEGFAISLLNECYDAENIKSKTQQLGKFVEVVNLGYTHVDMNMEYEDGDSYFNITVLDPRYTFVVRSNAYIDKRIVMAVTFRVDDLKVVHYTCYTKDSRFDIAHDKIVLEEMNPLHEIPIIEWIGNYDGMGCFEHQISEMNNLNLLVSDFTNDVDQNTQAIWHGNDVEFPTKEITHEDGSKEEVVKKPQSRDWLLTYTTQDGKQPFVKALSIGYDYPGMLSNIMYRRNLILEKCYVPQRNDDNGGSTGIAMQNATGYTATESVADAQQNIMESCKMNEVKVVLAAIKASPYVSQDSPLLKIRRCDIQPNIKRMKLSEMATKVNSLATMISHGVYGKHAFETSNLFADTNQVWEDSKDLVEKYQASLFDKEQDSVGGMDEKAPNADRTMQDQSDQTKNSPNLRG